MDRNRRVKQLQRLEVSRIGSGVARKCTYQAVVGRHLFECALFKNHVGYRSAPQFHLCDIQVPTCKELKVDRAHDASNHPFQKGAVAAPLSRNTHGRVASAAQGNCQWLVVLRTNAHRRRRLCSKEAFDHFNPEPFESENSSLSTVQQDQFCSAATFSDR